MLPALKRLLHNGIGSTSYHYFRGLELSQPLVGAIEMLLPWQRSLQTRSSLKAFNAGQGNEL